MSLHDLFMNWQLQINYSAHLLIFLGCLYVAIHNTRLPQWHITPLWYVGVTSAFVSVTILCEWIFGREFPLSYWSIGILAETLCHISIAAISVIMFHHIYKKCKHK